MTVYRYTWYGLLVLIVFNGVVMGADETVLNGMADKATHGFVNLVQSPLELPMQVYKGYSRSRYLLEDSPATSHLLGSAWGLGRGMIFGFGRAYLGVFQLFGFWSADPTDNNNIGVPFDGEYPIDIGLTHDIGINSIHVPITNKLKRGLGNCRWALQDFPLKIPLLTRADVPTVPLATASWFAASRCWVGVYETTGCWLPSAQETEGYSFDPRLPPVK